MECEKMKTTNYVVMYGGIPEDIVIGKSNFKKYIADKFPQIKFSQIKFDGGYYGYVLDNCLDELAMCQCEIYKVEKYV